MTQLNYYCRRLSSSSLLSTQSMVQSLLLFGIFFFTIGILVTYSYIMKIESDMSSLLLRRSVIGSDDHSSGSSTISSLSILPKPLPGRGLGSGRGHVSCDADITHLVSYWNDPRSNSDRKFQSPFSTAVLNNKQHPNKQQQPQQRYLSFEPDRGGWNNIRMEFEIMFVLAAATGRILIMPPDNPIYLLNKDRDEHGQNMRALQSFFHTFTDVVSTMSMQDFFALEVLNKQTYPLPTVKKNRSIVTNAVQNCEWYKYSNRSCFVLNDYLTMISNYSPNWHGEHDCLIMDDTNWFRDMNSDGGSDRERDEDGEPTTLTRQQQKQKQQRIQRFCGTRSPVYYNAQIHTAPLMHIRSHTKDARLLVHYYAFIYFTNPIIDNYYKRLVRDRVRYSNDIFCAAGKIVKSLITESGIDKSGYYSMHIRRGKCAFNVTY